MSKVAELFKLGMLQNSLYDRELVTSDFRAVAAAAQALETNADTPTHGC
jgi:hypothetical protein